MKYCINKSNKEYKELESTSGLNPLVLQAKIASWQQNNNTDEFPTLENLGIGVKKTEALEALTEAQKQSFEIFRDTNPRTNKKTYNKLLDFCKLINPDFKIEVLENLSVNGIADIAQFYIGLRAGNLEALSEEVAHFYIELMKDKDILNRMIKDIKGTSIYRETYLQYGGIYKNADGTINEEKIAKEAIGKLVSLYIDNGDVSAAIGNKSAVAKFIEFIKEFLRELGILPMNDYLDIAQKILQGEVQGLNLVDIINEEYYQVNQTHFQTISTDLSKYVSNRGASIVIEEESLVFNGNPTAFYKELQDFFSTDNKNKKAIKNSILVLTSNTPNPLLSSLGLNQVKAQYNSNNAYDATATLAMLRQQIDLMNPNLLLVHEELNSVIKDEDEIHNIFSMVTQDRDYAFEPMNNRNIVGDNNRKLATAYVNHIQGNESKYSTAMRLFANNLQSLFNRITNDEELRKILTNSRGHYSTGQEYLRRIKELSQVAITVDNFSAYIEAMEAIGDMFDTYAKKSASGELLRLIQNSSLANGNADQVFKSINVLASFAQRFLKETEQYQKEFAGTDLHFTEWLGKIKSKIESAVTTINDTTTEILVDKLLEQFDDINFKIQDEALSTIAKNKGNVELEESLMRFVADKQITKDTLKDYIMGRRGDLGDNQILGMKAFSRILETYMLQAQISKDPIIVAFQSIISTDILDAENESAIENNEHRDEIYPLIQESGYSIYELGELFTTNSLKADIVNEEVEVEGPNGVIGKVWVQKVVLLPVNQFHSKYDTKANIIKQIRNTHLNNIEEVLRKGYTKYLGEDYTWEKLDELKKANDEWIKENFYTLEKDEVRDNLNAIKTQYQSYTFDVNINGVMTNVNLFDYLLEQRNEVYNELSIIRKALSSNSLTKDEMAEQNKDMRLLFAKLNRIRTGQEGIPANLTDEAIAMFEALKNHNNTYYEWKSNWKTFFSSLDKHIDKLDETGLDFSQILDSLFLTHNNNGVIDYERIMYDFHRNVTSNNNSLNANQRELLNNLIYFIQNNVVFKPTKDYYDTRNEIYKDLNRLNFSGKRADYYHYNISNRIQILDVDLLQFVSQGVLQDPSGEYYFQVTDPVDGTIKDVYVSKVGPVDGMDYHFAVENSNGDNYIVIKNSKKDSILGKGSQDIDSLWTKIIEITREYRTTQGDILHLPLDKQLAVTKLNQLIEEKIELLKQDNSMDKDIKKAIIDLVSDLDDLQTKKTNYFYFDEFIENIENLRSNNSIINKLKNYSNSIESFKSYTEDLLRDSYFINYMKMDTLDELNTKITDLEDAIRISNATDRLDLINKLRELEFKRWFLSNHFIRKETIKSPDNVYIIEVFQRSYHWVKYEPRQLNHIEVKLDLGYSKKELMDQYKNDESKKDDFGDWLPKDKTFTLQHDGIDETFPAETNSYKDFMNGLDRNGVTYKNKDVVQDLFNKHFAFHVKSQEGIWNGRLKYMIPFIEKDVTEKGLLATWRDGLFDTYRKQEEGIDTTKDKLSYWQKFLRFIRTIGDSPEPHKDRFIRTDDYGNEVRDIPTLYTTYIPMGQVSMNVFDTVAAYNGATKISKNLINRLDFVKLLEDRVNSPHDKTEMAHSKQNLRAKRINNYIEQVMERKVTGNSGMFKVVILIKKWRILMTQSTLNPLNNLKNVMAGLGVNNVNITNHKAKANYLATANHASLFMATVQRTESTKDILIHRLFNPSEANFRHRFTFRTGIVNKNNFDDLLYAGSAQGEFLIANQFMYAILLNTTVWKNQVKTNLYEAMVKDGSNLSFEDIYLDENSTEKWTTQDTIKIQKQMHNFRLLTQGQSSDPIVAKRYVIGTMLTFMMNYFIPTSANKWRLSKHHNLAGNTITRGTVTEFMLFFFKSLQYGVKGQNYSKMMMPTEQEQAMKGAMSTALIAAIVALIVYGFGYYDDDENDDGKISKAEKSKKNTERQQSSYASNIALYESLLILQETEGFALFSMREYTNPLFYENARNIYGANIFRKTFENAVTILHDTALIVTGDEESTRYKKSEKGHKRGDLKVITTIENMFTPKIFKLFEKNKDGSYNEEELIRQLDEIDKSNIIK